MLGLLKCCVSILVIIYIVFSSVDFLIVILMHTLLVIWIWGHALHRIDTLNRGSDSEGDLDLQSVFNV